MKKGFTQTLMMVAVVLMAAQAMAMAPIISEIPSPVVGDAETATPANTFVYPDAIDLANYVHDDTTTNTSIVWYYETVGTTGKYSINGMPELTAAEGVIATTGTPDQVAALPTSKIIAGPGAQNQDTTGTKALNQTLITVRNTHLSPIAGPNQDPGSEDQTQAVTLYASDGETVAQQTVTFLTAHGGDFLSPSGIKVADRNMVNTTAGFTFEAAAGTLGGHAVSSKGICMTVGSSGDNTGIWDSPFSDIPLVARNAYRIRLVVNGTQTAENTTPLWDVMVDNMFVDRSGSTPVGHGKYAYGADYWMYDGTGGENAYVQFVANAAVGGDTTYDFWWTPAPVLTTRWNDTSETNPGLFAPSTGTDKDAYVRFRMIDNRVTNSDANKGIHGDKTQGTLCLKSMVIERYEIGNLTVDPQEVWHASTWTVGTTAGSGWHATGNNVSATKASTNDGVVVKAAGGSDASADFYAAVVPGDGTVAGGQAAFTDDYPCPMEPKTLYKVTMTLSAPTQNDMDHPVDAFWMSSDMLTMEEIQESYTTSMAWKHGMPSTTAETYVAFFYSNYGTNLSQGGMPAYMSAFRPYFAATNNRNFVAPGAETKVGAIKISSVKVEKVTGGFTR